MDIQKSVQFVEKVIEKTKSKSISWIRLREFDNSWITWGADGTDSFASRINKDLAIFLIKKENGIRFAMKPGNGLSTQYFPEDDSVQSVIIRLYNIVYDKFPNIDKIMDEFINSD